MDGKSVGMQVKVGVSPGMLEAVNLLVEFLPGPVHGTAAQGFLVRDIQVDQQIRVGDELPHPRHVGVFLDDMPGLVAVFCQALDKGRFPTCTGTNNADLRLSWHKPGWNLEIAEWYAHGQPADVLTLVAARAQNDHAHIVNRSSLVQA